MNQIYSYKQEGEIYFWSYELSKNYPGFHMAWSNGGKQSFQALLSLISEAEDGAFRTLKVSYPSQRILDVPNNKNSKVFPIEKLRIEKRSNLDWSLRIDGSICSLVLSPKSAVEWSQLISVVEPQIELSFKEISHWW